MNLLQLPRFASRDAFERFLKKQFAGSMDTFYQELNRLSDQLIRSDLKKAQQLTQKTASLEKLLPIKYRAHLYRIWGRHYHLSGEYTQAYRLYIKAIREFTKLRDGNSRARVQKALLDVLMYLGRYSEGLSIGRQSLAYYRRRRLDIDAAQVLTNIGNLYHRLDQNRKALLYYDQAYDVFKHQKGSYALALIQYNRANIYSNLNELAEAEKLYRQAADIYRPLGLELAAVQAEYSLAYISFLKGAFSQSLKAFAVASGNFQRLGDRRCCALADLDRIEVYLHLNLFSEAIANAPAVADKFRALGMCYEQGKAIYFAAAGYFAFGNYGKALKLTHESFRLFRLEHNESWQALCRFMLARIDSQTGHRSRALRTLQHIAAVYKGQGDERRYYDTQLARLETMIESHADTEAKTLLGSVKPHLHSMAGYQRYLCLLLGGNLFRQKNDYNQAIQYYRNAIHEAQTMQASIIPDEIRRFFWMDKLTAFTQLAALYLNKGKKRQAYQTLESGRLVLALISHSNAYGLPKRTLPPRLDAERRRLKSFLRKVMIPVGAGTRAAALPGSIRSAEVRLWHLEGLLRDNNAGPIPNCRPVADHLRAIQFRLQEKDVIIRYVCRGSLCGAYIINRSTLEYLPFQTTRENAVGLLSRLYFLTTRTGECTNDEIVIDAIINEISQLIWQPLSSYIAECPDPYIIADGILDRVPFNALKNRDGSRVFERFLPRLIVGLPYGEPDTAPNNSADGFSECSILAASPVELPGSTNECQAITRYLRDAAIYIGPGMTSDNLIKCLEIENGLVHLIAHAAQSYENHLFSTILLSDGPFYPFDLSTRPVRARLVVLSGCQTGDPGLSYSGDSISLAHSFLFAGAHEVVASYWPVSDDITCLLMEAFYRGIANGFNHRSALRNALSELHASTVGFKHWAGFYLIQQG